MFKIPNPEIEHQGSRWKRDKRKVHHASSVRSRGGEDRELRRKSIDGRFMAQRTGKLTIGILLLLTLAGLGLRLWGISWGLPFAESRPDEIMILTQSLGYGSGDLRPHYQAYPALISYLVFFGIYR